MGVSMSRHLRSFRALCILFCALAGAYLAYTSAPGILQSVYSGVRRVTTIPGVRRVPDPPISAPKQGRRESPNSAATAAAVQADLDRYPEAFNPLSNAAVALLGLILGAGVGSLVFRLLERANLKWDRMESGDKVNLFLGAFAGVLISVPFLVLFSSLGAVIATVATLALMVGISLVSIYALNSMNDVLPWQRSKGSKRRGIKILDTNVIIDGRIYDVVRTGFLEGQIYVPRFVLEELQFIADSADPLRRQRGKRGLEVLRHLQADYGMEEAGLYDRFAPDPNEEVDSRLVRLAKSLGGDIVTNDFNLNRVASLQNVMVLNINDLALALKPNVLPSETVGVTIIREGNQAGQGVGYLDDGTMVVVEHGRRHINQHLDATVTQVIQTERGKMIFAEVDADHEVSAEDSQRKRRGSRTY